MSEISPQVVGFGQCSLDILGQVGQYPHLDQKAELRSLQMQGGGPVATAMVTLARLGIPVAFAGAIGDDEFGQKIYQGLLDEQVDCRPLVTMEGCSSQVAFISIDDQGHRNIFWHRGTASPQVTDAFQSLLSDPVRVLHLDGLHLESAVAAATIARERNLVTVLDAGTLRPGVEKLLPLIDHLVVSEKFACQLLNRDDPQSALGELIDYGAKAVTVTLGASGSFSLDSAGESFLQKAFPVDVIDTTGCGDVFHGGYIYGLLQNLSLRQTVRFAAACAALKTRAVGGRTAIPTLCEVNSFLDNCEDDY